MWTALLWPESYSEQPHWRAFIASSMDPVWSILVKAQSWTGQHETMGTWNASTSTCEGALASVAKTTWSRTAAVAAAVPVPRIQILEFEGESNLRWDVTSEPRECKSLKCSLWVPTVSSRWVCIVLESWQCWHSKGPMPGCGRPVCEPSRIKIKQYYVTSRVPVSTYISIISF